MVQVNVHEAKSNLSALIARVVAGERITIARAGVPAVDLVPHAATPVSFGLLRGEPDPDPAIFDGRDDEIDELFYGSA